MVEAISLGPDGNNELAADLSRNRGHAIDRAAAEPVHRRLVTSHPTGGSAGKDDCAQAHLSRSPAFGDSFNRRFRAGE
jgi:hypothetical protein